MKKLFLYVFLGLLWCNISAADIKVLNKYVDGKEKEIRDVDKRYLRFALYVVCVDGLKFLMAEDLRDNVVDVEQMIGTNGKPETCSMD